MKRQTAVLTLLAVCLILVLLLLMGIASPLACGSFFALALAVTGVLSRGFSRSGQDAVGSHVESKKE